MKSRICDCNADEECSFWYRLKLAGCLDAVQVEKEEELVHRNGM